MRLSVVLEGRYIGYEVLKKNRDNILSCFGRDPQMLSDNSWAFITHHLMFEIIVVKKFIDLYPENS